MPTLQVIKNYADGTALTQLQLDQAFDSIQDFVNTIGLDSENIQASSIGPTQLAANAVITEKLADGAVTAQKLATEIINRLTPVATVIASATSVTPQGYLYCNGAAVSRTVYSNLFNAIGTAYGNGDTMTTFNLPDVRGFFLRGQDDGRGNDPDSASRANGTYNGNSGDALGSYQADAFFLHSHGGGVHSHLINDPGHTHANNAAAIGVGVGLQSGANASFVGAAITPNTTGISIQNSASIIVPEGGGDTRPKNLYVRYYIKF